MLFNKLCRSLLYGLAIFASCSAPKAILIDQNASSKQLQTTLEINEHSIKGDVLKLSVTYKGCKKDTLQLVTNGMHKKTNPPSIKLFLIHKNCGGDCDENISKMIKFDVSNLKLENTEEQNTLMLNIENYPTSIEYVY